MDILDLLFTINKLFRAVAVGAADTIRDRLASLEPVPVRDAAHLADR
jgi:hypothetical protein